MTPFVRDNLSQVLRGKKILLGISGSIAAFKACDIIRGLRDCGALVRVVLTESAEKFVTKVTLETLSGNPVTSALFDGAGTHHIDAARWADLALVAPATANTIAKLATGLADDLLSTELLAFRGPLVIAPAMNPAMYHHPATQANVHTLRTRGCNLTGPNVGDTACGEEGLGRMAEPDEIIETVARCFYAQQPERVPSNCRHVLITLGPTRSAVDPVRYLSNRSSGLMGAALAWAAAERGYTVTAVCGPCDVQLPLTTEIIRVTTAAEMATAVSAVFPKANIFVSAAAVLDWDISNYSDSKRKRQDGPPSVEFSANTDILASVSRARTATNSFILGFAAETDNPLQNALQKLRAKNCDAIFANDVSSPKSGFESTQNGGWWITRSHVYEFDARPKLELARDLFALIEGHKPARSRELFPERLHAIHAPN